MLQLPQSTVSRHLKSLTSAGLLQSRRDGTSRFYALSRSMEGSALWKTVSQNLPAAQPHETAADERRLEAVLAERRARSRDFFSSAATEWDRLREQLYGRSFQLRALLALLDPSLTVADLGCGTGAVSDCLAPFVRQVYAIDGSLEMLQAARSRLSGQSNVHTMQGELEALPLEDASVDAALLVLVLQYLPEPAGVLREAFRILRPGGKLLIVDLIPHERKNLQLQMKHAWAGFEERTVRRWLDEAGLIPGAHHLLPPDPESQGPQLFAATAQRPDSNQRPVSVAITSTGQRES